MGHVSKLLPLISPRCALAHWAAGVSARTAKRVTAQAFAPATFCASAAPLKRRGLPVPTLGRLLQQRDNFGAALGMLRLQRAALEDALEGLGHV